MKWRGLIDYTQPIVAAATLLALGLILSAGFGAYSFYRVKASANKIEVTGSAKEAVLADFARWTITLETKTSTFDQQAGIDRLEKAAASIAKYLETQGLTDIEAPTANLNPDYLYEQNKTPTLVGYNVNRQIVVRSAEVEKIENLAKNIRPLLGDGYNVSTGSLEFTYQGLPEMRVKLLSGAIKDAEARAEAIAKETGRRVGPLRSATGGVVQVLPQGGVDISDYGSYDTMSKSKDIMVTVRASFEIK